MKLGELIKAFRAERNISQREFAALCGDITNGYVSMLESDCNPRTGQPIKPSAEKYRSIARAMGLSMTELFEIIDDSSIVVSKEHTCPRELIPVTLHKIPILGNMAAGKPIYSDEPIETYVDSADHKADFALVVKGDSMDPLYKDGDIVYIRSQSDVCDGQIAAVGVDDEATLKRVYHTPNGLQLLSINPAYPPMLFTEQNSDDLRIFGLAVGYYRKTV